VTFQTYLAASVPDTAEKCHI